MTATLYWLSVGFRLTASMSTRGGLSSRRVNWLIRICLDLDSGRTQKTSA